MKSTQKVDKTIVICDKCESFLRKGEAYITVNYALGETSVDICESCLCNLVKSKLQDDLKFRDYIKQKQEFNRKRLEKCFENNGELIW